MDLVEFLRARLGEDELFYEGAICRCGIDGGLHDPDCPRRVLAEVEAKRRIVELADEASGLDAVVDGEFRVGSRDPVAEPYIGDLILRHLAAPYAGHPDYDARWRP